MPLLDVTFPAYIIFFMRGSIHCSNIPNYHIQRTVRSRSDDKFQTANISVFAKINRTTSSSVDSDQIVPRCRADFSLCPKNAKSFLKCENKVLSWTELMAYQTIACVKNDNKNVGKLGSLFYRF